MPDDFNEIFTVEELEPWLLPYVPKSGQIALDIGANHGAWSRFLATRFNEVHAFEPQMLDGHEGLPENVRLYNAAIGRVTGDAKIYLYERSWHASAFPGEDENSDRGPSVGSITVPCFAVDDLEYTDKPVEFIKIDVEGLEEEVIRGAWKLLAKRKPTLLIEIHNAGVGRYIETKLPEAGYEITNIPHPHLGAGPEHRWIFAQYR